MPFLQKIGKFSEIYPRCLLQVIRHVNNKIVRKRDNRNQSKLEIMMYKKVEKDNKCIRKKQLFAEQNTKPQVF